MYGVYKALGHYPDYWYWILRGRPTRSPHLLKQKTVREYGARYNLRTLVETGTYYGEMVAAMKRHFDHIYSIEFVPELAERAQKKFAGEPHIKIFCGDSRKAIPEVLSLLTEARPLLAGCRLLRLDRQTGRPGTAFVRTSIDPKPSLAAYHFA